MAPNSIRQAPPSRQLRHAVLRAFHRPHRAAQLPEAGETRAVSTESRAINGRNSLTLFLGWAAVVFFVCAVTRRGWISDDAFITMRVVDHLIEGRGFVYNADERVLGITNPLWALVLTVPYLLVRDPYLAPILASILVSGLVGALVVFRSTSDARVGALLLVALSFSRSFVDFSTSGLENPLTHLLLVLFYVEFWNAERRSMFRLSLFAALLVVNRFDSMPLFLPPLIGAYRSNLSRLDRRSLVLGWLPAMAWFAFAIVYYGFPLPNTAYAKLNAEIPKVEMLRQGVSYLADTLVNDPGTALLILAAVIVLAIQRRSNRSAIPVLWALVLEIAYVALIGGDFMSGRFLTPAAVVSAVVIAHSVGPWLVEPGRLTAAALAVAATISCLAFSPLRDEPLREKRDFPSTRIVNERAWFQEHLLLHLNLRPVQWKEYGLYADGKAARERNRKVVLYNNVGMFAWGAGPDIHIVDDMALTDPLLARIPFTYREDWRTGHLPRAVPDGYIDTLESGTNVLRDPCIAHYFEQLNSIVRGPLFTVERWASILLLNLPGGMTVRACPERVAPPAIPPSMPATAAGPPEVPADLAPQLPATSAVTPAPQ